MTYSGESRLGAKGEGLAKLAVWGMTTPETVLVAVERDDWQATFQGFPPSSSGQWILRSSPLAAWELLPRLSGLYASVGVESRSVLPDRVEMLRKSRRDREALDRARTFGIQPPDVTGLLQPLLTAEISGITHVGTDGALRSVWTPGHLSRLADGSSSGHRLSGRIGSLRVTGNSDQERELRHHRSGVLGALHSLAPLGRVNEALEVEWLVTPDGDFYALQAQRLEMETE
ncbi:hypothetical protein RKE30_35925 [Streptomyces sp. Li-HN-5-11]|uniref:hypothetical protein n=1 Tax=Streptomyces sp. Li-HN-5-11 TaxID=3075432 RepID=UPI0028A914CC|nr:hypothetical protein [Streptomyces sp. Li-HN-5-11]WNM35372.1 hypothetical protein RKE30_35925 [Streptomyces sp. Li-HN-5-11]